MLNFYSVFEFAFVFAYEWNLPLFVSVLQTRIFIFVLQIKTLSSTLSQLTKSPLTLCILICVRTQVQSIWMICVIEHFLL